MKSKQKVVIDNVNIEYNTLSTARSVLGPFLFLIFKNDFHNNVNYFSVAYKNDITLIHS